MPAKNWRFIIAGGVLAMLAIGFFVFMQSLAPQSTDPRALMETVGSVSGVVVAIGIVLVVLGFMGKGFPKK